MFPRVQAVSGWQARTRLQNRRAASAIAYDSRQNLTFGAVEKAMDGTSAQPAGDWCATVWPTCDWETLDRKAERKTTHGS